VLTTGICDCVARTSADAVMMLTIRHHLGIDTFHPLLKRKNQEFLKKDVQFKSSTRAPTPPLGAKPQLGGCDEGNTQLITA